MGSLEASPALDRTSLPPEQVVVGLMLTAQPEVRTLDAVVRRACGSRATRFDSLHNKHGHTRGEHCHRGDRYDDPSQAGTRLALHQFLIRSDDQDGDQKERG
jgi:hypothetical protein